MCDTEACDTQEFMTSMTVHPRIQMSDLAKVTSRNRPSVCLSDSPSSADTCILTSARHILQAPTGERKIKGQTQRTEFATTKLNFLTNPRWGSPACVHSFVRAGEERSVARRGGTRPSLKLFTKTSPSRSAAGPLPCRSSHSRGG